MKNRSKVIASTANLLQDNKKKVDSMNMSEVQYPKLNKDIRKVTSYQEIDTLRQRYPSSKDLNNSNSATSNEAMQLRCEPMRQQSSPMRVDVLYQDVIHKKKHTIFSSRTTGISSMKKP